MTIDVEQLTAAHDTEVESFLDELSRTSPAVLGYHYPFYRDMLVELGIGSPIYLGARRGDKLVGLMPIFVRESEVGIAYCSLPYFGPNAGVLCASGPESDGIHEALLSELIAKARDSNALSCAVYTPFLFADFSHYDARRPDAMVERFTQFSHIKNVEWDSSIRYDLRRAERLGVRLSTESSASTFDEFYSIYAENCAENGIPLKPKQCIEKLAAPNVLGRRSSAYFAYDVNRLIGGLLVVHSPVTVSYYIPCTRRESRPLQPGTALIDKAFRDMQAAGMRIWNWESSPRRGAGVYQFKGKWNATEASYRIYVWCFRGLQFLRQIGRARLAACFPHYFVYPYDRL
jgi:hypothetical protein